ncbi:serine proteinase stubble-like [Palaemon carinicauda]|uniref:serine proteinase stubble-like n=1 Tax=Palaemon carinicauda TaxID=392227 RepID=UPI0035B69B14
MTERWKTFTAVSGLVILTSVAMVFAVNESRLARREHIPLRIVGSRLIGDRRQQRSKNQLSKWPAILTDAEEVFKRTKQKEYTKKKRKEKSKRRRKKLKLNKELPAYIRRVASMVAPPLKQRPSREKKTKKVKCGNSYTVGGKSKYRIKIFQRQPCSVIFRAVKGASMKLVCTTISVGDCEDAEYLISDGEEIPHRYCGSAPSNKVRLTKTNELLVTYKPSQEAKTSAASPDVNCLVKGRKGTGYVAKGKQICPFTCGKTTAAAEAEKPYIKVNTVAEEKTTPRLNTEASLQEPNITRTTTQLNALPNTTISTSPALSNSLTSESTSTTPMHGASISTASSVGNTALANAIWTNFSTPSLSLEGRSRVSLRIQGGKPADIGEWPFIVSILIQFRRATLPCSGTILTPKFILTASHCVYDVNKKRDRIKVIAYEYNMKTKDETPRQTSLVRKIILHPEYDYHTQKADIALLLLQKPFVFGEGVSPVCIAPPGDYVGARVVILGWGSLKFRGKDPDVLHEATQKVVDVHECAKNYSSLPDEDSNFPITSDHLCAASPGIDSCEGDSGGPVLVQIGTSWYQLGIISFGFKCAVPGFPGVNTYVPSYTEWIFSTVNDDTCQ